MKKLLTIASVLLLGFSLARAAEKPNVLFIAIDDLRDWVGYLGNKQVKTPNLDKLAARGVSFTRSFCASPCCNPSRTALTPLLAPMRSPSEKQFLLGLRSAGEKEGEKAG